MSPEQGRDSRGAVPPGWPRRVPPPGQPGFEERATGWLLDVCPPEYRGHDVLLRNLPVLAWLARRHVSAQLEATAAALSQARAELAGLGLPTPTVEAVLEALHAEGSRLRTTRRGCELIEGATAGRRWVPRL